MSLDGDLEHLPIVDVIQLLHATGKSGTLTLKSAKGESQLVFMDGCVVSANHVNNSVRIGQVMLDMGLITREDLDRALQEQQKAGAQRKPIIQTLIEGGMVATESAYKGLEALIEMTIVEVLTWTKGTFSLDVDKAILSDDYRYFPETVKRDIHLNTQNILMDALRIYDERKRDGTLTPEAMFGTASAAAPEPAPSDSGLSAADLGLDNLEELEEARPRIPQVFSPLEEAAVETPAMRLQEELSDIADEDRERLWKYLESLPAPSQDQGTGVVLLTRTKLLRECTAAVCGPRFICATDDPSQLDPVIDQALGKGRVPILLLDADEPGVREGWDMPALLRQKRERYPELAVALIAPPADYRLIARGWEEGMTASLPRPTREERPESFIDDAIDGTEALRNFLNGRASAPATDLLEKLRRHFRSLEEQREPSEVSFALLQAACSFFPRGMTLVVVRSELIAERAVGLGEPGAATSVKLRMPATQTPLFERALEGEMYYGNADAGIRGSIFAAVGAPASGNVLLLPVKSFGRVIAVIYADFGSAAGGDPQLPLMEMLALHAGMVIDNALYRKRCAQK